MKCKGKWKEKKRERQRKIAAIHPGPPLVQRELHEMLVVGTWGDPKDFTDTSLVPSSPRCSRDMGRTSEKHHKYSHHHFINKEQLFAKQLSVLKGNFLILCGFSPMAHLTTSGLRLYQK